MDPGDLEYYGLSAGPMTPGNRVRLLRDGREAYPEMLAAIESARSTAHLETYILRSDRAGLRFAAALMSAAQRGVAARLLYDAVGSLGLDASFTAALANSGVQLAVYRPLFDSAPLMRLSKRDHRKILVVDGSKAFAGGLNIADDYAPLEDGGHGWRDNHASVEGPAAAELDAAFLEVWDAQTGQRHRAGPAPPPDGPAWVRVLTNRTFLRRHRIGRAYRRALHRAKSTIDIASAYFLPDVWTRRALKLAARRGVRVRLLVPARSDVELVRWAGRRLYDELLSGGARVFEYEGSILHAKTAIVDGVWGAVGSYNMDPLSLWHSLEVTLNVVDESFGRELADAFEADLEKARELSVEEWRKRPWSERVREAASGLLSPWL